VWGKSLPQPRHSLLVPSDGDIVSFLLQVAEEDLLPLRFQSGSHVFEQSELGHVVAGRVTEEREPLDMVADLVTGIWVHKAAQWAAVDDEPWDEGSELRRGVDVHFPHSCCMRRPWGLKDAVDFQLGDYVAIVSSVSTISSKRNECLEETRRRDQEDGPVQTFSADAFVQLVCVLLLFRVILFASISCQLLFPAQVDAKSTSLIRTMLK
jgi:hypothetical protein